MPSPFIKRSARYLALVFPLDASMRFPLVVGLRDDGPVLGMRLALVAGLASHLAVVEGRQASERVGLDMVIFGAADDDALADGAAVAAPLVSASLPCGELYRC